ncbi:hypothetical protein BU15DRAFT_69327 [Melanogaster broomeanus]|nr:hypothetical protein BU15DRAFT_69327 [Melanogaster broomeanus]
MVGHTNCPARPLRLALSRRGITRRRSQSPSASAAHPAKRQKTNMRTLSSTAPQTSQGSAPAYEIVLPEGFAVPLPQAPDPTTGPLQAETVVPSSSDPHQFNMFLPRPCTPQLGGVASSDDSLHLDLNFDFADFTDLFSSLPDHVSGSPDDHNTSASQCSTGDALHDVSHIPSPEDYPPENNLQPTDENEMFMRLVMSVTGVDSAVQNVGSAQDVAGPARRDDVEWESEEEFPDEKYVVNDTLRSKRHSERLKRIMASIKRLEAVTRPYILIYVARPESVLARNGKAKCYASPAMLGVLGKKSTFVEHLHRKVKEYTQQQVMS